MTTISNRSVPGTASGSSSPAVTLPPDDVIFGRTARMAAVRKTISKVAKTSISILITGESGTGKEIVAKFLHAGSELSARPFVQVNCAAIPATLLESELFGYEKGAFTGAVEAKPGRIELAHSGTLFLDEIGELDSGIQAKLLQVLQDGQFCRIGGQADRRVNVRTIYATNRDLEAETFAGKFREDLFYRINVVHLHLPPLRERLEDVRQLTDHFIAINNERFERQANSLSDHCISCFEQYHWPGNIRQLENLIKKYVVLGSEDSVLVDLREEPDIFKFIIPPQGKVSLKQVTREAVRQVERKLILKMMEESNWNRRRAAERLNISYRALLYKLEEAGVPPERRRRLRKTTAKRPILSSAPSVAGKIFPVEGAS